jgi:hypothetical protein
MMEESTDHLGQPVVDGDVHVRHLVRQQHGVRYAADARADDDDLDRPMGVPWRLLGKVSRLGADGHDGVDAERFTGRAAQADVRPLASYQSSPNHCPAHQLYVDIRFSGVSPIFL